MYGTYQTFPVEKGNTTADSSHLIRPIWFVKKTESQGYVPLDHEYSRSARFLWESRCQTFVHCLQCASVGPISPERCPFTNPLALIDTFAVLRNPTARQVVDIRLQRATWDSKRTGSTRSALQTLLIQRSGAIVGCDITWSFKAIVPARKWLYIVAKTNHSVASIEFAQRNVKALTARALSLVKKHCCSCF